MRKEEEEKKLFLSFSFSISLCLSSLRFSTSKIKTTNARERERKSFRQLISWEAEEKPVKEGRAFPLRKEKNTWTTIRRLKRRRSNNLKEGKKEKRPVRCLERGTVPKVEKSMLMKRRPITPRKEEEGEIFILFYSRREPQRQATSSSSSSFIIP